MKPEEMADKVYSDPTQTTGVITKDQIPVPITTPPKRRKGNEPDGNK